MVMVCNLVTLLAALAFGVILGRMWEMRKELLRRRPYDGSRIPTARIWQP
jgi:hypothetical protein